MVRKSLFTLCLGLILGFGVWQALAFDEPPIMLPTAVGGQTYPALRPGTTVSAAFAVASGTISSGTVIRAEVLRVTCSTACLLYIGTPVAETATSPFPLPANTARDFRTLSGTDIIGYQAYPSGGIIHYTLMK